jgi:hypothetical protein
MRVNTGLDWFYWTWRGQKAEMLTPTKKPGVIAVQSTLRHHVVRDVTRLLALIKLIADLMTGDDRSLPGRERDAPGRERAHEIAAVDRVIGMRGRACYCHDTQ